ncbi:Holliday junction branch migration protein RuvA [Arcanobacterium hippocoleae]|uniref:Holliday junction branch migration complex subunit RuvA n=1 Tax=Arcanobacterium hippocoleae TaxID=149017 RepID=A0ABU1T077_9ACTO|nr:Holliday junction branch migration protein RuvA [Arcanobacterium hippocoleae]MDR6938728.1 Holliday junction DNA helicase RuvA [Arcanobacterium hippocoleae]
MISSLSGEVLEVHPGSAVIEVGGMGFHFFATANTLSHLHIGESARVLTALIVREDALILFGFADADERDVFNTLLGVSGIGAKTALAALAVLSPDDLRGALMAKDEKIICKVPGIGPKVAKRIILEIGDKLGAPVSSSAIVGTDKSGVEGTEQSKPMLQSDVLAALVNLGWHERAAQAAVAEAVLELPSGDVPQVLRLALQILGSRR